MPPITLTPGLIDNLCGNTDRTRGTRPTSRAQTPLSAKSGRQLLEQKIELAAARRSDVAPRSKSIKPFPTPTASLPTESIYGKRPHASQEHERRTAKKSSDMADPVLDFRPNRSAPKGQAAIGRRGSRGGTAALMARMRR